MKKIISLIQKKLPASVELIAEYISDKGQKFRFYSDESNYYADIQDIGCLPIRFINPLRPYFTSQMLGAQIKNAYQQLGLFPFRFLIGKQIDGVLSINVAIRLEGGIGPTPIDWNRLENQQSRETKQIGAVNRLAREYPNGIPLQINGNTYTIPPDQYRHILQHTAIMYTESPKDSHAHSTHHNLFPFSAPPDLIPDMIANSKPVPSATSPGTFTFQIDSRNPAYANYNGMAFTIRTNGDQAFTCFPNMAAHSDEYRKRGEQYQCREAAQCFVISRKTQDRLMEGITQYKIIATTTPDTTRMEALVTQNDLVETYNAINPGHPIEGGDSGDIGGVGLNSGRVLGLQDTLFDAAAVQHNLLIRMNSNWTGSPHDFWQICHEVWNNICLGDETPFYSLHFDEQGPVGHVSQYSVLSPVWDKTKIMSDFCWLDFGMKGFVNDGYIPPDELQAWESRLSTRGSVPNPADFASLRALTRNAADYVSAVFPTQSYVGLGTLLKNQGVVIGEEADISVTPHFRTRSSFRIIGFLSAAQLERDVLILVPKFEVRYTIDPHIQQRISAEEYRQINTAFHQMAKQLELLMPQLPLFQNQFQTLMLTVALTHYFKSLRAMGLAPVLKSPFSPMKFQVPRLLPPIPKTVIETSPVRVSFGEIWDKLSKEEQTYLEAYVMAKALKGGNKFFRHVERPADTFIQRLETVVASFRVVDRLNPKVLFAPDLFISVLKRLAALIHQFSPQIIENFNRDISRLGREIARAEAQITEFAKQRPRETSFSSWYDIRQILADLGVVRDQYGSPYTLPTIDEYQHSVTQIEEGPHKNPALETLEKKVLSLPRNQRTADVVGAYNYVVNEYNKASLPHKRQEIEKAKRALEELNQKRARFVGHTVFYLMEDPNFREQLKTFVVAELPVQTHKATDQEVKHVTASGEIRVVGGAGMTVAPVALSYKSHYPKIAAASEALSPTESAPIVNGQSGIWTKTTFNTQIATPPITPIHAPLTALASAIHAQDRAQMHHVIASMSKLGPTETIAAWRLVFSFGADVSEFVLAQISTIPFDLVDETGTPLIHWLIRSDQMTWIQAALSFRQALANLKTSHGETALHIAAFRCSLEVTQYLVRIAPHLLVATTITHETPLDYAKNRNHPALFTLLAKLHYKPEVGAQTELPSRYVDWLASVGARDALIALVSMDQLFQKNEHGKCPVEYLIENGFESVACQCLDRLWYGIPAPHSVHAPIISAELIDRLIQLHANDFTTKLLRLAQISISGSMLKVAADSANLAFILSQFEQTDRAAFRSIVIAEPGLFGQLAAFGEGAILSDIAAHMPTRLLPTKDADHPPLLFELARTNRFDAIHRVLANRRELWNLAFPETGSLAEYALRHGAGETAFLALAAGYDTEKRLLSPQSFTAYWSIVTDFGPMLELYLSQNPSLTAPIRVPGTPRPSSIIELAVTWNSPQTLQILGRIGAWQSPEVLVKAWRTALYYGSDSIVRWVGLEISDINELVEGHHPAAILTLRQSTELMHAAHGMGIDFWQPSASGLLPIHLAIRAKEIKVVTLLIRWAREEDVDLTGINFAQLVTSEEGLQWLRSPEFGSLVPEYRQTPISRTPVNIVVDMLPLFFELPTATRARIQALLDTVDINTIYNWNIPTVAGFKITLIGMAISRKWTTVADEIISRKPDWKLKDNDGQPIGFYLVTDDRYLATVKTIFKKHPDAGSWTDKFGNGWLHYVGTEARQTRKWLTRALVSQPSVSLYSNTIHDLVSSRNEAAIKDAIARGADIDVLDADGNPPIFYAITRGSAAIFEQLASAGACLTRRVGPNAQNLASVAIVYRQYDMAQTLISRAPQQLPPDDFGNTLLHDAVSVNEMRAVRLVVANGYLNDDLNSSGRSPLQDALLGGRVKIARYLLSLGATLNPTGMPKLTRNIDPRQTGSITARSFDLALQSGSLETVRLVLTYPQTTTPELDFHNEWLSHAVVSGRPAIVSELHERFRFTPKQKARALEIAIAVGNCSMVQNLLSRGFYDPLIGLPGGQSPLRICADEGHTELAMIFLTLGHDPLAISGMDSASPMAVAIVKNRVGLVRLFVQSGLNINVPIDDHRTPLQLSVMHLKVEVTLALLRLGAKPNLIGFGETPIEIASIRNSPEICALLYLFGANPSTRRDTPLKSQLAQLPPQATIQPADRKAAILRVFPEESVRLLLSAPMGTPNS